MGCSETDAFSYVEWQVEVINPDDSPANGIPVVISPGNVRGITASNGMARLTINTAATDSTLKIIVSNSLVKV